jgi:hypothetical protein
MEVPDHAPDACPVCERPYDSVSRHDDGLLVNLLDNDRYRRVCFHPVTVDGASHVDFYHHTHPQCDGGTMEAGRAGDGTTVDAKPADDANVVRWR